MTIAEQIERAKTDYDKVYEAGQKASGGGYDEGFEAGKQAEYNRFWDNYQINGTRVNYQYGAFGGTGWNDETYKPKYPITAKYAYNMYMGCQVTEILGIDFSTVVELNGVFRECSALIRVGVVDGSTASNATACFSGAIRLQTIDEFIVNPSMTFLNTFANCKALANIVIGGTIGNDISFNASPLSKDSIISIITHLSDTTSGKTLTLMKSAVNTAFETSSGAANGSNSDEWNNLIATKSNWNISLV